MSFGEEVASIYDKIAQRGDELETVAFLGELAHGGPVLELAIGTGRIALPLAARAIRVDGIDLSPAMVARLRAKPGGDQLAVTIGDFADVDVTGTYQLIYVVFNTLFNLLTQDDQVRCFVNVAQHLTEDGSFLVEAAVPAASTACKTISTSRPKPYESTPCDSMWLGLLRCFPVRDPGSRGRGRGSRRPAAGADLGAHGSAHRRVVYQRGRLCRARRSQGGTHRRQRARRAGGAVH